MIELPPIPETERTALIEELVRLIETLAEQTQQQTETIQQLRDEIAALKAKEAKRQAALVASETAYQEKIDAKTAAIQARIADAPAEDQAKLLKKESDRQVKLAESETARRAKVAESDRKKKAKVAAKIADLQAEKASLADAITDLQSDAAAKKQAINQDTAQAIADLQTEIDSLAQLAQYKSEAIATIMQKKAALDAELAAEHAYIDTRTNSRLAVLQAKLDRIGQPPIPVAQRLKEGEANVRIYGGLTLGPSPYQTDQSESLREGTDYINATPAIGLQIDPESDSQKDVIKKVGAEQGLEFDYKPEGSPFHLIFNYGYSRVSKSDEAFSVAVPDVYISSFTGKIEYRDDDEQRTITYNLPAVQIHKRSHNTRFGLRQYLKFKPVIKTPEWYHLNGIRKYVSIFYGAGVALIADQVRGVAVQVPEQILTTTQGNTPNIKDPVVQSFNYNHTQLGVYAEVGAMVKSPDSPIHVGIQARFQENPMDMTVGTAGEKLLGRSRSLIGTVFGGISF